MQDGDLLAKQYSIDEYLSVSSSPSSTRNHETSPSPPSASSQYEVKGFVYVETDRKYHNELSPHETMLSFESALEGPFEELAFLRRMVAGTPEVGEGFDAETRKMMKGCVLWAPLDKGAVVFKEWAQAVGNNGPAAAYVKGFRFLLQGIRDKDVFEKLVKDEACVQILREMGRRGWSFDIGVDARQGGNWQLDIVRGLIERVHDGVENRDKTVFILSMCSVPIAKIFTDDVVDHLCKPDMEEPAEAQPSFELWKASIARLSACEKTYMKLSGGFSEIADQDQSKPWPISELVERMRPWVDHVFLWFTPQRVMFGSDWPVCNVRGPGDAKSWRHWRAVIEALLEKQGLSDREKDTIWYGTAVEAYNLEEEYDHNSL